MYSIDIKNALNDGTSLDALMHNFKNAIKDAQEEIEKEKANTARKVGVDQCREDVIVALTAYLDAIGALDVDTVSKKDMEKLEEFLKDFENEITKMMTIINMIVDNRGSDDAVDVAVKSNKTEVTDILADVLAKLG